MALATRPSQRSDGRMVPAAVATTARQPRRTPSSAAKGMASVATGKTHQPAHPDHAAIGLHAVEVGDLFGQGLHGGVATSAGELPLPLGERVGVRGQVTFDRPYPLP